MEPTSLQPLCPSTWAQTGEEDNQTLPWVEMHLGFKPQENSNELQFVHSQPSLLPCSSPPNQLSEVGQFLDPAHLSHFALVLPLLLQGLSPLQNGLKGTVASPLCERALPAPSPLGHAWASHTSLPAVTCFPTHPSCKGRARPWLSSRLLPLTDTPLLTPASRPFLRLAHCSTLCCHLGSLLTQDFSVSFGTVTGKAPASA